MTDGLFAIAHSIEELGGANKCGYELIADSMDKMSLSITKGAVNIKKGLNKIAEAGLMIGQSNYQISRSILDASKTIFSGLNNIADVMERNNRTQEYYMLLKEIENYENYCIEHKIIGKVYETMDLNPIPTLEQYSNDDIHAFVYYVTCSGCSNIEIIKKISTNTGVSPIVLVANALLSFDKKQFIEGQKYYRFPILSNISLSISSDMYSLMGTNDASGMAQALIRFGYEALEEIENRERFATKTENNEFHTLLHYNDHKILLAPKTEIRREPKDIFEERDEMRRIDRSIIEARANPRKNDDKIFAAQAAVQRHKRYLRDINVGHENLPEILALHNKANVNIQFENLKMLHLALRSAVRDYKIQEAMKQEAICMKEN